MINLFVTNGLVQFGEFIFILGASTAMFYFIFNEMPLRE